jgi:hypothetical protein
MLDIMLKRIINEDRRLEIYDFLGFTKTKVNNIINNENLHFSMQNINNYKLNIKLSNKTKYAAYIELLNMDIDELAELPEGGPRVEGVPRLDAGPIEYVGNVDEPGVKLMVEDLEQPELIEEVIPRKRTTKKVTRGVIPLGKQQMITIGDTPLARRLPPPDIFDMKVSSYYMNNREIFVNFVNGLFDPYKEELLDESKGISCEDIGKDTGEVSLLTHQKIVRDYINLYTPYRGLLLYHGLGSGKTCTSIAIAEGMKSSRKIIIMTPASLKRNYMEEIKKCGDLIYRKNQYWEWISIDEQVNFIDPLSAALGLPREYIRRNHGAWLTNITKPSNYNELTSSDKKVLNDQLDEMIKNKYTFINYNGLRREKFKQLTNNFENNIFDNAVVIIDEAHNLISRIVNKINKISNFSQKPRGPGAITPQSLALILYEFLLKADNCRIVLLTGTPIINYSNEIGILFNILRGYIKTWNFTLNSEGNKLSKEVLQRIFANEKVLDYIDYVPSSKTLIVTRNPYGFENKITVRDGYKGVTTGVKQKRNEKGEVEEDYQGNAIMEERGTLSDTEFIIRITKLLGRNDITAIPKGTSYSVNTALPDTLEEFVNNFIDKTTGNIKNVDKFKRRIIGLTSYFRSAQEGLLPAYDKNFDRHEVIIPMSDYQFKIYEDYRFMERKSEKPGKKSGNVMDVDGIFKEPSSTYRIFSRLACNFVMPTPPGRPNPAEYREFIQEKEAQVDVLLETIQRLFTENKLPFTPDIQENYNSFITNIPEQNLKYHEEIIKTVLDQFVKAYASKKYKGTIENFARQNGHAVIFEKLKPAAAKEAKQQRIVEKAAKEQAKAQEKAAREQAKADAKAVKERQKEDEKVAKERQKEEEKAAKEQAKADAKAEKDRQKEEEKRLKAEEKERKRLEKVKKGGANEDSDDDDEDSDDNDSDSDDNDSDSENENDNYDQWGGKQSGGAGSDENPAERMVNSADDDEAIELEGYKDEDAVLRDVDELEGDEILETMGSIEYKEAIKAALRYLKIHAQQFLSPKGLETYSPKFLAMLDNIEDPDHPGLHLIYSQFRSMEGIGIFAMTLDANGFAQFKIRRTGSDAWEINMSEEDMGKPCYALYTGTEDAEEREIIRNIYNGAWDYIPNNIATQLRAKSSNNNLGEIIKVLMITSAGSEGINLRNTRYVHIMEPYWHPVRLEQVIGRARRICSHQGLPKALQTVEVFIYIMTLTKAQIDSEFATELRLKDVSKRPPYLYQTSDEKLYEILTIKEQLNSQLLTCVKESSIDCATHAKSNMKEGLVCLSFGQPNVEDFSYNPNFAEDENDTVADINRVVVDWDAQEIIHPVTGKRYMQRLNTNMIYDYDSVIQAKKVPGVRPILIGRLVGDDKNGYEIVKERV